MTADALHQEGGKQLKLARMLGKEKENEHHRELTNLIEDEGCAECKLPLARASHIVNIGGHSSRWHAECFKCALCRERMDKKQSCHLYRDQIICRNDYLRLKRDHIVYCARCHWPIAASDWVRKAASYVYHIACFNCDICLRQLNTGEQFIINAQRQQAHTTTVADQRQLCGEKVVRLLCRLHFSVEVPSGVEPLEHCNMRGEASHLELVNGADRQQSVSPARKQSSDGRELTSQQKYRKTFNSEQFSMATLASAGRESESASASLEQAASKEAAGENQMDQARTFMLTHQHQQLAAGSSAMSNDFALDGGQRLVVSTSVANAGLSLSLSSSSSSSASSSASSASSTSSSSPSTAALHANYLSPMTPTNSSQTSSGLPCKSKRVRTTFTDDQLSILQTHFQIDSNPDGQDLERIATITGLSKRVTQVWFQNSRARQKKYLIKRKPISGAASLALAASFNMAPGVGAAGNNSAAAGAAAGESSMGAGPHGSCMTPFRDAESSLNHSAGLREPMDCTKVDLASSWQHVSSHHQQPGSKGASEENLCPNENYLDSRSISSNDDDDDEAEPCSMIMDENSHETRD